jgi:serine/threonine protein kinase
MIKIYSIDDFKIINSKIASGKYGSALLAVLNETNEKVILKKYIDYSPNIIINQDMILEVLLLNKLNKYPETKTVKLYGICITQNEIYIVLERLGLDLAEIFINNKTPITNEHCKQIFYDILTAVDSIHSLGIIHNDIKANNIMFKYPNKLTDIRIIDFGLSNFMGYGTLENISNYYIAAEIYLAPDTYKADPKYYVNGNRKTYVTDIFSVASTIVHICLHRYGLLREINNNIYMDNINISNELKELMGEDFYDLILNMITSNCKFRFTAKNT